MRETVSGAFPLEKEVISREQARELFGSQPYKLELIDGIPTDEPLSTYCHGGFVDL